MTLASRELCSGCAACFAVCTRHAIAMCPDNEGFLRPVIDVSKCVNCGHCEKACPVLHRNPPREPLAVYAARAKDDEIRLSSSSGGIFTLLARQIIAKGGIVYGAAIRKTDLMVVHQSAENEEELAALRGSKYVQSDVGDTYREAKRHLDAGRSVLYSGTPCQIAALRRVLGRDYPNCLCVEVICHAAPSPLAWQKYLEQRTADIMGRVSAPTDVIDAKRISFRRKNCGWKRYSMSLRFTNDMEYLADLRRDPFLRGFLSELYNRPSCHACVVRELRSGADLTIADYWNVQLKFPELDDDKGTSIVLINSSKGKVAFQRIENSCYRLVSDYVDIRLTNPAIYKSKPANPKRQSFFNFLFQGANFDNTIVKLTKRSILRRLYIFVKAVMINVWKRVLL